MGQTQKIARDQAIQMPTIDELLAAGMEHHRAARLQQAEQAYRQILQVDSRHSEALHLLGVIAHQTGRNDAAVELISRAIATRSEIAVFHNSLGEAYRSLGQVSQAVTCYQRAIALCPSLAEAHNNLGTVHQAQGDLNEAIACFDRAISLRDDYANAHYNRARAWLTQGDFTRGWLEYEWRWRRAEFHRPARPEPEWDGADLAGRTMLVECEQGLGDTLQFVRYVKSLDHLDGEVAVEVQPSLLPLLEASGFKNLFAQGQSLPRYDVRVAMLSLPLLCRTTVETILSRVPYLSTRPERVKHWHGTLSSLTGFRVGIHWQGNPRSPLEPWRSVPLAAFEPLARVDEVRTVSLQKGAGVEQLESLGKKFDVLDLGPSLDQHDGAFVDTAAVMAVLDLVVTSDSAVAHLAGALGVPVWVVLNSASDWRWMQDRADCPWYPTMRLFRQPKSGDWSSVFQEVAGAMRGFRRSGTSTE